MQEVFEEELAAARSAREFAYAPYSSFRVGAALRDRSERITAGCNIENVSLGLTLCAERVALGSAIVHGLRDITVLALVADSDKPVVPCGACRQVLAEFNPQLRIVSSNLQGVREEFSLDQLLPLPRQGILETVPHGT